MPRPILLVLCALVCAGAAPATATADPGDLLVRFNEHADSKDRHAALNAAGVQHQESLPVSGLERVDPLPGVSVEEAAAHLRRDEDVVYAEADATRTSTAEVDDTRFDFQWGFQQISAPEAWDVTVGSDQVKVAVLDTGADLDHPDLVANLVSGWDFVDQDPFPYDDSDDGHGTHVAGVIGAGADNGLGVAGLNWHVQLMPLRTLGADGRGTVSSEVEAIAYGAQRGVKVVNMSFAGDDFSHAEYDAIKAARDTLFVVASGNEYGDNDRVPAYPCNYELDNVVCVTASGTLDTRPVWANVGARSVDLAAPGVAIYSTLPGGHWGYMYGTSMAAPHVAGAAALLAAEEPRAWPEDMASALTRSADHVPAFAHNTVSGGRLNVAAALDAVVPTVRPPEPSPTATPVPSVEPIPTVVAPPLPAPAPPPGVADPAKLKVKRASVANGRLELLAEITRRAMGSVVVSFRGGGKTTRLQVPIAAGGKIRVSQPLAKRVDGGILTLSWAGSSTVRPAAVRLRAAAGPALLRRGATRLRAGVMSVEGTISRRARGSVRLSLEYVDGGQVRTATYSARISGGRWRFSGRVPDAARHGGYLTIQFTGYAGAPGGALRGEQDAKQLAGG